jgi:transcriptional regulator with XRE-family HTH domain
MRYPYEAESGGETMDDLQQTLGAIIRRERRERDLTLKELAERSIISVVYLGEIERGKKYPSPVVLERLAKGLDLETPDLLEIIADELRAARQPALARPIGFAPHRIERVDAPTPGFGRRMGEPVNLVSLVGALVA